MNGEAASWSGRSTLVQTLSKNWWLLALFGVLNAAISVIYLAMYLVIQNTNRPLMFHQWGGAIVLLGELTLAAGGCSIAAGIWRSQYAKCWLLVLNGVALGALGLIYCFFALRYPISLLTVALLIVLMATSVGILELVMARTLRRQRHAAEGWFFGLAGVVSVGFALPFLTLGFRWIKLEPRPYWRGFLWLASYFGFSAICMLGLALRLHSLGPSQHGPWQPLPPLGNPEHAH